MSSTVGGKFGVFGAQLPFGIPLKMTSFFTFVKIEFRKYCGIDGESVTTYLPVVYPVRQLTSRRTEGTPSVHGRRAERIVVWFQKIVLCCGRRYNHLYSPL